MVTMFTNCKTTDWLTKGISSKKLAKEKAKVIAKAKKQIEKNALRVLRDGGERQHQYRVCDKQG